MTSALSEVQRDREGERERERDNGGSDLGNFVGEPVSWLYRVAGERFGVRKAGDDFAVASLCFE